MTLSEPLVLWALLALPVLAALSMAARRPRHRVVATLRLWEKVKTSSSRPQRRWTDVTMLLLLLAGGLALLGASDPGVRERVEPGREAVPVSALRPSPIVSASVSGEWLYVRLRDRGQREFLLKDVVNARVFAKIIPTGDEILARLPSWNDSAGPLVLETSDGEALLGFWPQPVVMLANSALASNAVQALTSALYGLTLTDVIPDATDHSAVASLESWRVEAPAMVAIVSRGQGATMPSVVSGVGETTVSRATSFAAVEGFESLLNSPEFLAAASSFALPVEPQRDPLVWANHGSERHSVIALDPLNRAILVAPDFARKHANEAWVPELIALCIHRLTGRNPLDPMRYTLNKIPASSSKPLLTLGYASTDAESPLAPGIYPDGVINHTFESTARTLPSFLKPQTPMTTTTHLDWIPLLAALLVLFTLVGSDIAKQERALRGVASATGALL